MLAATISATPTRDVRGGRVDVREDVRRRRSRSGRAARSSPRSRSSPRWCAGTVVRGSGRRTGAARAPARACAGGRRSGRARRATTRPSAQATPNHGWSATVSVKSRWAMWIQYSCGSFTHTHRAAAVHSQNRGDQLRWLPAQRDQRVDDEEVLERVREHDQHRAAVEQLERQHADEPVVEEELADAERGVARPVAHHRGVRDREVVDVERLVDALVGPVGPEVDIRERGEQRVVDRVEDERDDDDQLAARNQQRDRPGARGRSRRSAPTRPWWGRGSPT